MSAVTTIPAQLYRNSIQRVTLGQNFAHAVTPALARPRGITQVHPQPPPISLAARRDRRFTREVQFKVLEIREALTKYGAQQASLIDEVSSHQKKMVQLLDHYVTHHSRMCEELSLDRQKLVVAVEERLQYIVARTLQEVSSSNPD